MVISGVKIYAALTDALLGCAPRSLGRCCSEVAFPHRLRSWLPAGPPPFLRRTLSSSTVCALQGAPRPGGAGSPQSAGALTTRTGSSTQLTRHGCVWIEKSLLVCDVAHTKLAYRRAI